ncbi:MAG: phosphate ABC transporter substrate-binding protein PstS [Thermoplasmata archaeon]
MSTSDPSDGTPATGPSPARPVVRRQSRTRTVAVILAIVVVLILVVVVVDQLKLIPGSKTSTTSCPTGVTLQGEGAGLLLEIMSAWQSAYNSQTSNEVNYNDAGSGAGLTAIAAPTVDFATSDNPPNATQTAQFKGPMLTLPIIGGAVAMVYNLPGLTKPVQLTGPLIADIYMGTITKWNDPAIVSNNSGITLPDDTILAVHRADAAGTTYVLTNMLSDDSPAWASGPGTGESPIWPAISNSIGESKNSGVLSEIQSTPYALGYVDLTDTLNAGVQYAKVLNPAGVFVLPNLADTESAITNVSLTTTFPAVTASWSGVSLVNSPGRGDYPLVTFAYFFVYQSMNSGWTPSLQKSEVLLQWLHWVLTTGQDDAAENYYTPLPNSVVQLDQTGLGTVTYNGAGVPTCS